jgi:hypothetical protein
MTGERRNLIRPTLGVRVERAAKHHRLEQDRVRSPSPSVIDAEKDRRNLDIADVRERHPAIALVSQHRAVFERVSERRAVAPVVEDHGHP